MSEMIERVAMAIQAQETSLPVTPANLDPSYIPLARAAIEAMRKPTQDMVGAGGEVEVPCGYENVPVSDQSADVYRHMIDAALSPSPKGKEP